MTQDNYNFDEPDAFDWNCLHQAIKNLKERKPFNKPIYDFLNKQRMQETKKVYPQRVIIIEGHMWLT